MVIISQVCKITQSAIHAVASLPILLFAIMDRMLTRYMHKGLTWVDLESPTRDEVLAIVAEFDLRPLVGEDMLMPSTRARTELHGHYMYVVLHFPVLRHAHKNREQEIDFVIGKNFLVTARYDTIDPLHKFAKVFETTSVLSDSAQEPHAGLVFFSMLKVLYRSIDHELDQIRHRLRFIEEHIFVGEEVSMVTNISKASRDLLNLRQIIEPHREILHSLETEGPQFFGADFAPFLHTLGNEYFRVHNHLMREIESLHELRETNNSLLSTKQNETMKIFTIMAFTTFPLTLIATIFGMGTKYTPIIGTPGDFWIVIGLMVLAVTAMFAFFRSRKWL